MHTILLMSRNHAQSFADCRGLISISDKIVCEISLQIRLIREVFVIEINNDERYVRTRMKSDCNSFEKEFSLR